MIRNTLSALVALVFASSVIAAEPAKVTYKVNGTTGAGATTLAIGDVANDKVNITLKGIAAVWKEDPGAAFGAKALPSEDDNPKKDPKGKHDWVLSYTTNPAAFEGAKECIVKRGSDWPGSDLKSLKLDDPRVACAPITGADGTYTIDVAGDYEVLGLVPVIEFANGDRAWGSHPFGQSRGKNNRGKTITLLEVVRDGTKATNVVPASNPAKKFFAGNFQ